MTEPCPFCREAASGTLPESLARLAGVPSRIIDQSEHLVCVPSVSPLCVGHVLILPRHHVCSLGHLEHSWGSELLALLGRVEPCVRRIGQPLFFEHGVAGGGRGCGIDHAHLHMLPLPAGITNDVLRLIEKNFPRSRPATLSKLLGSRPTSDYLAYGTDLNDMRLVDADIPSQMLRRLVAEQLGLTGWDWRALERWDEFRATLGAVRSTELQESM